MGLDRDPILTKQEKERFVAQLLPIALFHISDKPQDITTGGAYPRTRTLAELLKEQAPIMRRTLAERLSIANHGAFSTSFFMSLNHYGLIQKTTPNAPQERNDAYMLTLLGRKIAPTILRVAIPFYATYALQMASVVGDHELIGSKVTDIAGAVESLRDAAANKPVDTLRRKTLTNRQFLTPEGLITQEGQIVLNELVNKMEEALSAQDYRESERDTLRRKNIIR